MFKPVFKVIIHAFYYTPSAGSFSSEDWTKLELKLSEELKLTKKDNNFSPKELKLTKILDDFSLWN